MIYPSRGSRRLFCAYSDGMCVCVGGQYRVNNARCVGVVTFPYVVITMISAQHLLSTLYVVAANWPG